MGTGEEVLECCKNLVEISAGVKIIALSVQGDEEGLQARGPVVFLMEREWSVTGRPWVGWARPWTK
jgi:hypothetical protein